MKKQSKAKKLLTIAILSLFMVILLPQGADAAGKTKLNITKKTVYIGKTYMVKMLNNKKKVKWSVSNKNISIVRKNNKQAKIKGVSKGTSYLKAKVGSKTYKCKILVKVNRFPYGKNIGKGEMYLSTAGGTSQNRKIPKILSSENTTLIQIGLNAWGFNGNLISYVYIDDKLYQKMQLSDCQCTISLQGKNLKKGIHRVCVVQYGNDKKTGEIITYKETKYKIVY